MLHSSGKIQQQQRRQKRNVWEREMATIHKRDFPFAVLDVVRSDYGSSFLKTALQSTDTPTTELNEILVEDHKDQRLETNPGLNVIQSVEQVPVSILCGYKLTSYPFGADIPRTPGGTTTLQCRTSLPRGINICPFTKWAKRHLSVLTLPPPLPPSAPRLPISFCQFHVSFFPSQEEIMETSFFWELLSPGPWASAGAPSYRTSPQLAPAAGRVGHSSQHLISRATGHQGERVVG